MELQCRCDVKIASQVWHLNTARVIDIFVTLFLATFNFLSAKIARVLWLFNVAKKCPSNSVAMMVVGENVKWQCNLFVGIAPDVVFFVRVVFVR